jgi:hypothetical protein
MRIYVTHCSAKKRESARRTGKAVPPDVLYASERAQRFVRRCQRRRVRWAIFSDLYGVWFPREKRRWYEKSPDRVSEADFRRLVASFDGRLARFREIWFYHHPGRFHRLYRRLLRATRLRRRVRLFRHVAEIE